MIPAAAVHFSPETAHALLLLSAGAFLLPLLCRPINLPAAVGEILFGLLVGPHVLGWVQVTDFVALLGQVGFFLLMFLAGLELDFGEIERGGWPAFLEGLAAVGLLFTLAFAFAALQGWPFILGLVLAATSIGLPLVMLHETGLARGPFGQKLLLVGSIGEYASILAATGVAAYFHAGGVNATLATEAGKLAVVFVLAYVLLLMLRTAVWWRPEWFARLVETHDPSEIGVRAGLALMFVFVGVTATFGIDPILGAFLSGALFSFAFREKGPLETKFLSLGNGFFIPFFFVTVGLNFNIGAAMQGDLADFVTMLAALYGIRWLALALMRRSGMSWTRVTAGAALLAAPLTLLVVIANLSLGLGLLDEGQHATVLMLAVVSSTLYPFAFKALAAR